MCEGQRWRETERERQREGEGEGKGEAEGENPKQAPHSEQTLMQRFNFTDLEIMT